MKDILSDIIAHKKREVADRKKKMPLAEIEKRLSGKILSKKSMREALRQSSTGIIAEFKRKSPSKGWINKHAEVSDVVPAYAENGAAALSVLTDAHYFGGSINDLEFAASTVNIPVMRKEFIVDEYQLFEAKLFGADAVLLIAAALSPQQCQAFTKLAHQLELETLLELHDENEVEAICDENKIIGINNRNLGTFTVDVEKSFKMSARMPQDVVLVSESGISSPQTVKELREVGFHGFLIGENFMKCQNPGKSLHTFIDALNRETEI